VRSLTDHQRKEAKRKVTRASLIRSDDKGGGEFLISFRIGLIPETFSREINLQKSAAVKEKQDLGRKVQGSGGGGGSREKERQNEREIEMENEYFGLVSVMISNRIRH
jgi:hypothetical protein